MSPAVWEPMGDVGQGPCGCGPLSRPVAAIRGLPDALLAVIVV